MDMDTIEAASETVGEEETVPAMEDIPQTSSESSLTPTTRQPSSHGHLSVSRMPQIESAQVSVSSLARHLAINVASLRHEFKALQERVAALGRLIREEQIREMTRLNVQLPSPSVPTSSRVSGISNAPRNSHLSRRVRFKKSKYAKKRRLLMPGGAFRVSRSFKDKPLIQNVGSVDLSSFDWYEDPISFS